METSITSKSESIQMVYNNYVCHRYVVNRRYQRKLVWSIQEKAAFMDSIMRSYSVPLFLLAQNNLADNKVQYEIIDGMQRLNAVFAFIENEFPIKYEGKECYFDLDTLADTMVQKGKSLKQKMPKLPKEVCIKISNYQFPFSFVIADKKDIEEIFQRINSYGKKLSEQEIRQAGALGLFPDLIRKTSAYVRGDVSLTDLVPLEEMRKISLTNKGLNYGIDIDSLFWTENGIVTKANIRVSRDEELVAHIYSYILLGKDVAPSSHTLNILYDLDDDNENIAKRANDAIQKIGLDNLINNFRKVYDVLLTVIEKSNQNFKMLIFKDAKASGAVRTFQIIFLSLYDLIINEGRSLVKLDSLVKDLDGIGKRHLKDISGREWNAKYRTEKIKAIRGIIERDFDRKDSGEDVSTENWVSQLENLLSLSITEGGQYDFKQGFYSLDGKGKFETSLIDKILKTLTAEVNKGPNTHGYVIIGVSDKKEDALRIKELYGTEFRSFKGTRFFVSGVNGEIEKFHHSDAEAYLRKIKDAIKNNKGIDSYTRTYILTHLKFVSYYGLNVLVLQLLSQNKPIVYSDKYYVRENDETKALDGAGAITSLLEIFQGNNNSSAPK